jgi:uncharacterized protein YmfQ (DUF2313 family)
MAVDSDYQSQLFQLLPQGKAWPRYEETTLARLLLAFAGELARVDARVDALLREAYPLTTFELLTDWERVTGLPDGCISTSDSLQARRDAVMEKLARRGGQSRQFFIDLAATLGFTITITEYRPFLVGRNRMGDRLYGEDWRFAWLVTGPSETYRYFRMGQSVMGERLRSWGNDLLECIINRLKPAHTVVRFAYEEIP